MQSSKFKVQSSKFKVQSSKFNLEYNNGFTLVELSIVIVIIGLIVAGVVGGQALINQAKLRNIIADVNKYKIAINAFNLEYIAYPGDFSMAFGYWPTNCAASPSAGNCNGDGGGNLGPGNENSETVRFWRHLWLAGLIQEPYSGTKNGSYGTGESIIGVDVPAFDIKGSGAYVAHDNHWGIVPLQSLLAIGKRLVGGNPSAAYLTPNQAKSLDDKFDDGHPIKGNMISSTSPAGAAGSCINGTGGEELTNATAYILTNNAIACRTVFKLGE